MADQETLYDRLGGREAIHAVVDDFYGRLLADDDIGPFFEETDMESLKEHQTDHLVEAAGGPAEYTGPDVREAHLHIPFTPELIGRSVEYLEASLEEFDVTGEDKEAVVGAVTRFKADLLATEDDD